MVKGPPNGHEIYDTPASSEKPPPHTVVSACPEWAWPCSSCLQCLLRLRPQVYDVPPSVSRDVAEQQPIREETYDVPPHCRVKAASPGHFLNHDDPLIPEDVYDVPPPTLGDKQCDEDRGVVGRGAQDIYDVPASLQVGGHRDLYDTPASLQVRGHHDLYDFPRDREDRLGDRRDREQNVYDVPPQVRPGAASHR